MFMPTWGYDHIHMWYVRMCGKMGMGLRKETYHLSNMGGGVKMCQKVVLLNEGVDRGSVIGCLQEVSTDPYLVRQVLLSGLRQ